MTKEFFQNNRRRFYDRMRENSVPALFSAVPRTVEEIEGTMRQGFVAFS